MDYDLVQSRLKIDGVEQKKGRRQKKTSFVERQFERLSVFGEFTVWAYYMTLSCIMALLALAIQFSILHTNRLIAPLKMQSLSYFMLFNLLFGTISTAICHYYGVEAQSAGLPELKCILSGGKMLQFL